MVTKQRPSARVALAWSLVAGFALVATLVSLQEREPDPPPRPVSVADAEALLTEAVRLARFTVHRTRDTGLPRSSTPVYWLPMGTGSADVTCVHGDGHVRCGGPATAPVARPPR